MSGCDWFQIATTLSRSGAQDQKLSVTFCAEEAADEADDAADGDVPVEVELPPDELQPAIASAAIAAPAIAAVRTRRRPGRGERSTAERPPRMSFMALPLPF
jgi:hypothetical protein